MPTSIADYLAVVTNLLTQTGAIYWIAFGFVVFFVGLVIRRIRK